MNLKMNSKGQSAIEYLMTYGWALVVIVIAIAALVLILNPQNTGGTCTNFPNLPVVNHAVTANQLQLRLANATGHDLSDMDFAISGETTGSLADQVLNQNDEQTFTISGTFSGSYTVTVDLNYTDDDGLTHSAAATCSGNL
jgi:hypothetical protein